MICVLWLFDFFFFFAQNEVSVIHLHVAIVHLFLTLHRVSWCNEITIYADGTLVTLLLFMLL